MLAKDFKKDQLPAGARGAAGAAGATGAQGAKGDVGPAGAQGPKGDPGPTVTAFAQSVRGQTIGAVNDTTVIKLSSLTGNRFETSGLLVLPVRSRVLLNGFATLQNAAAATARGRCGFVAGPSSGTLDDVGPYVFQDFGATSNESHGLPLAATTTLAAGTYDVGISCAEVPGTLSTYDASFTVIASPAPTS